MVPRLKNSFLALIQKHQNYWKHKFTINKKNHNLANPENLWFISHQNQVNTFQDEIGPNPRQPSSIKGGNPYDTTKEYNEGEEEFRWMQGKNA
ncbi:hypothetical protein CON13_24930 [Bacillus cereus]|nr:hypothetical protein CON13_24930 [Bacillus cereus]PEE49883.1 hypothetical protein COM80_28720 [Bacillus cereus]PFL96646.1 hypothetical protein COJ35_08315 [Bacillus cereus]PFO63073.1 hypothetical protein COJ83_26315 [Bacillus cereus]PFR61053.1 hypothetical protein COK29_29420 [Bacillus cereus]